MSSTACVLARGTSQNIGRSHHVACCSGRDFHDQEELIGSETVNSRDWSLFLRNGPWRGHPSPCKNGLTTLIESWLGLLGGPCNTSRPNRIAIFLHQVAKCLTMKLAVYLAKEVAAILREVLLHDTKKLYDEGTVHLLCSNYWIQPIYQELLHSSSRYNATRAGERNRPSGCARVAHPRPVVVLHLVTSSFGLLYLKRVALRCLTLIHSWKLECLDSSCSSTSAFFG